MQTSDRVVARRYARALFESSRSDPATLRKELSAALRGLRDQQTTLRHPLLAAGEKSKLIRRVLGGQLSADTAQFLDLLIRRKRFDLLPYIAAELERIADEETKVARAHVRVAFALGEAEKAALQQRLEKYLGRSVAMDLKEDPALLGGIVVKVGDRVLDASITRQLERLREKLAGS